MKSFLALFILAALLLSSIQAAQKSKHNSNRKVLASGTKSCTSDTFAGVDKCCSWPKLLPYEAFSTCMNEIREIAEKSARSGKKSNPKAAEKSPSSFLRNIFKPPNAKRTNRTPLPGAPTCLIECAMKSQTLLTSSGALDIPAITTAFKATGNETWSQLIGEGIDVCNAELNKIDPKSLAPIKYGETKFCQQHPALLLGCLRRYLALRCPDKFKKTSRAAFCQKKMQQVNDCDPFSIEARSGNSG